MAICRRGFRTECPAPAADRRDHRAVVLAEVDPKSVPQCLEPRKPLRRVRHDPAGPRSEAPVSGSRRTRRTGPVGSGGTGGSPSRNNKVILVGLRHRAVRILPSDYRGAVGITEQFRTACAQLHGPAVAGPELLPTRLAKAMHTGAADHRRGHQHGQRPAPEDVSRALVNGQPAHPSGQSRQPPHRTIVIAARPALPGRHVPPLGVRNRQTCRTKCDAPRTGRRSGPGRGRRHGQHQRPAALH
jgi:hypothetical protein